MSKKQFMLLSVLTTLFLLLQAANSYEKHIYITPSSTTACPVEDSCLTLPALLANISDSITGLSFLPGNHILDSDIFLSNTGKFLELSAFNDTGLATPSTNLICSNNTSLTFTNISRVRISGLHFIGCSASVEGVDTFSLEDSRFHGSHAYGYRSALVLTQTNADIVRSDFSSNTVGSYRNHLRFLTNLNKSISLSLNFQSYDARVGGALLVSSTNLTISNSTFEDNAAQVGGAIFLELASYIIISNCTFVNNSATGCSDNRCHGGALFIDSGSTVTAHKCTFTNNTSGFGGGATALFQATYFGEENTFELNRAQVSGGVLHTFSSSIINIDSSFFTRNEAGILGGALFASSGGDITVNCSSFSHNMADYGGALWVDSDSFISVNHSSFANNKAQAYAGVIYIRLSSTAVVSMSSFVSNKAVLSAGVMAADSYSNFMMEDSIFMSNEAGDNGGVIYTHTGCSIIMNRCNISNSNTGKLGGVMVVISSSTAAVYNSVFDGNNAGELGGIIYTRLYSSVTVDSSFARNSTAGNNGGAVFVTLSSAIEICDSFFDKSKVREYGGVAYVVSESRMTVENSEFNANVAGNDGGVAYMVERSNIMIMNSSFGHNRAGDTGGVLYAIFSSSIKVDNSSFHSSRSGNDVGVLLAHSGSSIRVDNSFFSKNRAGDDGGVMYAYNQSNLTVSRCNFESNEAHDNGGVMYVVLKSRIIVRNSSFSNNAAGSGGGALRAQTESSIAVTNSSFSQNRAGYIGGVILVHSRSTIMVCNSSFNKNEADSDGGVIFAQSNSSISIDRGTFTFNKAGDDGGVMYSYDNIKIVIRDSSFGDNSVGDEGGIAYIVFNSQITMENSTFDSNVATDEGGVIFAHRKSSIIFNGSCIFFNNSANTGGVAYVQNASLVDQGSIYFNNKVSNNGGVFTLNEGRTKIKGGRFVNNSARNSGGVFYTPGVNELTVLEKSTFHDNSANNGGVIALFSSAVLNIVENLFSRNHAIRGGVIHLQNSNNLTVNFSYFVNNSASGHGGAIYSQHENHITLINSDLKLSSADGGGGAVYLQEQTKFIIAGVHSTFIGNQAQNGGAIHAIDSKVDVASQSLLMVNNTAFYSGGAIYTSKVNLNLSSEMSILVGNLAHSGGAAYASKSKISIGIHSSTAVRHNSAFGNGGGLYLIDSELIMGGNSSYISENAAMKTGGGLHATISSITVSGVVHLTHNVAENGGGVSLERYAKLYRSASGDNIFNFVSNRASNYGGALYVDDATNPDMCSVPVTQNVTSSTRCFFTSVFMNFSDNSAGVSGTNIFGGLLDRCTVNKKPSNLKGTEMHSLGVTALTNFSSVTTSDLNTISSHPVRLCFCRGSRPDCGYLPESIQVERGKSFSIEVIAYDDVSHAVDAKIEFSLNSSAGGLGEDQRIQKISGGCTSLQFDLFSPFETEYLTLSMDGPCNITGISEQNIKIEIICTCPIGFQIANNDKTKCICICDQVLLQYSIECNATTGSITRNENQWISYVNVTDPRLRGYLVYPDCPYDYCHPPDSDDRKRSIYLNLPNGSDAQCASNRVGLLCGTCKPGLSISLGSSQCLRCPTHWPALLVIIVTIFILSGIGFVALILVLNLTVAIGTVNAIVFYANIVGANKSVFFSMSEIGFASVLISWLNFDIGFHTCFFEGMDTYVKTWLELAFPIYIILLVVAIIWLSQYWDAFGHLIGKKDPVATLATLILISYTKLLQTTITALSYGTLKYPSGSTKTIWLPDATVGYLAGKHIILFIAALLILLFSIVHALALLTIQWTPLKLVKWIRIPEVCCIPYTRRHQYWTGLLLLVRAVLYVLSAFNPRITLSSTTFIMSLLLAYIAVVGIRMYSNEFINVMEIITYFNILALSIFTWFLSNSQVIITNISVGIMFIQLLVIILYHVCRYANSKIYEQIQNTTIYRKLNEKMKPTNSNDNQSPPSDTDIHQFYELLNMIDRPVNTNDYNSHTPPDPKPKPAEPTQSVVELPKHPDSRSPTPPRREVEEMEPEQPQQSKHSDVIVAVENQLKSVNKHNNCSPELKLQIPGTRMGSCINIDINMRSNPDDSSLDVKN